MIKLYITTQKLNPAKRVLFICSAQTAKRGEKKRGKEKKGNELGYVKQNKEFNYSSYWQFVFSVRVF